MPSAIVEPAGAAGVAALLEHPRRFAGPIVPVLSGGNIDALLLLEVIRHGLASGGRFLMFRVRISDRPGELMRLLAALAAMDVNILNVHHDRGSEALGVREVEVALQVATRGAAHREEVWRRLGELGYDPRLGTRTPPGVSPGRRRGVGRGPPQPIRTAWPRRSRR